MFRTNYNQGQYNIGLEEYAVESPLHWEPKSELPSETVPGQAMSIQDMLKRVASGLPISQKEPYYELGENDDDDIGMGHPDLSKMDLVDRQDYINLMQEKLTDLKDKLSKEKAKQKEAEQRSKVQRTSGDTGEQGEDLAPDPQNPKKTRGAGAAPRDTRKGSESQKGAENAEG